MGGCASSFLGAASYYFNVEVPTLECFSDGEMVTKWVQTQLTVGENSNAPYSYSTISSHLSNASKICNFLAVCHTGMSASCTAVLLTNARRLSMWACHYNNKAGAIQYRVGNLLGDTGLSTQLEPVSDDMEVGVGCIRGGVICKYVFFLFETDISLAHDLYDPSIGGCRAPLLCPV